MNRREEIQRNSEVMCQTVKSCAIFHRRKKRHTLPYYFTNLSTISAHIMTAHAKKQPKKTLYERLGGDPVINLIVSNFFDEIIENPQLKKFFRDISTAALKTHQVKLFRVIFGPDDEKPDQDDLLDFMCQTHTRLFRENGLDETHFDMVADCFVRDLQTFQIDQDLIDECVEILVPCFRVRSTGSCQGKEPATL